MPEPIKGIRDVYDVICDALRDEPFMDWIDADPNGLRPGQVCLTTVNYAVDQRWYLEVGQNPTPDEQNWLWRATKYHGAIPPRSKDFVSVARHFGLEKEEHIVAVKTKLRSVILLRESHDDWFHPAIAGGEFHNWYVAPTFSYRHKHVQAYVERDQKLENPENFYLPTEYGDRPGMMKECAARFHAVQAVPHQYLVPVKIPSSKHGGHPKAFQLTRTGLKILATHFYQSFAMFPELTTDEGLYGLFVEGVREYYAKSTK